MVLFLLSLKTSRPFLILFTCSTTLLHEVTGFMEEQSWMKPGEIGRFHVTDHSFKVIDRVPIEDHLLDLRRTQEIIR